MKEARWSIPSSVVILLTVPSLVLAAGSGQPPKFEGNGEVTEFVPDETGASFDIGVGVQIHVPPGIGTPGVVTFSKAEERPSNSSVSSDFSRHGATVVFDTELGSKKGPVKVVFNVRREPKREGLKFVLAVEHAGDCEGEAKKNRLETGDCGHWRVFDTAYDATLGGMVAEIDKTGGFRLQFGWVADKR